PGQGPPHVVVLDDELGRVGGAAVLVVLVVLADQGERRLAPVVGQHVRGGPVEPGQHEVLGDPVPPAPRGGEHLGGEVLGLLAGGTTDEVAVHGGGVLGEALVEPGRVPAHALAA